MTEIEEDQIMYRHSCKGIRLQSYQSETLSTITTAIRSLTSQTRDLTMGFVLPKSKSTVRFTLEQQTYFKIVKWTKI